MDTACCLTLQMETLRYGWIKEICPKWASQMVLVIKNPSANAGDIETQVQSLGQEEEGHGNLLQYSCLENPMNRGSWWATVHGVTKSDNDWGDLAVIHGASAK